MAKLTRTAIENFTLCKYKAYLTLAKGFCCKVAFLLSHRNNIALNLFRDIFPAARCVLLICFLSTTNTPQLAAGIFYFLELYCCKMCSRPNFATEPGLVRTSRAFRQFRPHGRFSINLLRFVHLRPHAPPEDLS